MDKKTELLQKIASREAVIGIVGMGYVGLPLAVAFAQEGFKIIGIDVSEEKVSQLNAGHSYVEDVADAVLQPLVENGRLRATI
ncbi:MAG: UDP-N-acetyl-D-glucosamine dehydrogenase, partial [Chloroflexi bacterium]